MGLVAGHSCDLVRNRVTEAAGSCSAVDWHCSPAHERGPVGEQEGDHLGDLLRLADPAERVKLTLPS